MRKCLTFCLILLITSPLLAQQLSVKSFRKLPNDLDARVSEPKRDQNGDVCAIIKVVTTQTGFSFDNGQIGIVKTVPKTAEIWVYVPYGTKRLTISHPNLGILRDYPIPIAVEKATVYELVLISGSVTVVVDETIVSQWLVITPKPADAMIYLNGKFVKTGIYQAKIKPGSYTYRVEAPKYHTEAGQIEITDVKKSLNVTLKPAFGYISITSEPEQGAKVVVDGEHTDRTTPCDSLKLSSGDHTVQVVKENFQPAAQKVTILDGKATSLKLSLIPSFADVVIQTLQSAEIFIDNESKGTGVWQGRLGAGVYTLEARLDKYSTAKKDIEVLAGENQNIELPLVPLLGSADVITNPAGAEITINGKACGTSPNSVNNLPVGEHNLQITMPGYEQINKMIVVTDGKVTEINENLTAAAKIKSGKTKEKSSTNREKANQVPVRTEIAIQPPKQSVAAPEQEQEKQPAIQYSKQYYKYKGSRSFWLVSGLVTLSAGTFAYLQSGVKYTEYQSVASEEGASALHSKVQTFDTIYPVCFGLAGLSVLEVILKSGKMRKAKEQKISLYPQPVRNGAGLGLVYNF